jgi:DNA-binding NarL/FixJ family response regulator
MYNAELPIIRMLHGGAGGYLLKDGPPRELETAIKAVVAEGFYHSEVVDEKLVIAAQTDIPRITEKEQQFLSWCCCDLAYKEIAERMGIGQRSAESYADTLSKKLGVKSRIGLAMAALQMGIQPAA